MKVCDLLSGNNPQSFSGAVIEDLSTVKSEIETIKQMVLVLAVANEKSKNKFAMYWTEYFK